MDISAPTWRKKLWDNPRYRYSKFHGIDYKLRFQVPSSLPGTLETTLRRLRLYVACTKTFLYLIGPEDSPYCQFFQVTDSIDHVLCRYERYKTERSTLQANLRVSNNEELTSEALLGLWTSSTSSHVATGSLLKYLTQTKLLNVLWLKRYAHSFVSLHKCYLIPFFFSPFLLYMHIIFARIYEFILRRVPCIL